MYDPRTVAHDIKIGKYYLLTIWHVDPESDGTDDSCGWAYPRLSKRDLDIVEEMVERERKFPYFSSPHLPTTIVNPNYSYPQMLAGDCLAYVAAAWMEIAWRRDGRRFKDLSPDEWWHVVALAASPDDNVRSPLADSERSASDRARDFLHCVMRVYLGYHRPWYRHPRWHIHHWKLQIHPIQNLKRWLFSRCARCGKRFPWGYAPVTTQWEGTGPLWFRSEERVYHHECLSDSSPED